MNLSEAMNVVRQVFPNATVGDDLDGQVIIYTGMVLAGGDGSQRHPDELIPFPEDHDNAY